MRLERIEPSGLIIEEADITNDIRELNNSFETSTVAIDGVYQSPEAAIDRNFSRILGLEDASVISSMRSTIMESTKKMLEGTERNGFHTLGLDEISKWKINSEYRVQNLKQQSGYVAEIISTYKENMLAQAKGLDLRTYRADDLPEMFKRNDQFVDKVRIDSNGNIIEKIQTKFIGKNGKDWVSKMMSKDFDKYFNGAVDKLECPSDYFDDVKAVIPDKISNYENQLARVTAEGKTEVAEGIQRKIVKLKQLDEMVEKSTASTSEAMYARLHPKRYVTKNFVSNVTKLSCSEGLKSGAFTAGLTFTISTVDNVSSFIDGNCTAKEMVEDIVKDTAAAGALGYGTTFISTGISQVMRSSSSQLIRTVSGSCAPAIVVSFAVESYDSISDFAQGELDGKELAYELGETASSVAGGVYGGAIIGSALGSVAGPAGNVVGGIVGGVVGCVIATEAYETAAELGAEGAEQFAEKAEQLATTTIDAVADNSPEQLNNVKSAFNDYIKQTHLPFNL